MYIFRISQIFCEDVANPMDIILFVKESRRPGYLAGNADDDNGGHARFFEFDDIYVNLFSHLFIS